MKYIAVCLLSLLIIYVGVGVPAIHFCCSFCQKMGVALVEEEGCHAHNHETDYCEGACEDTQCSIVINKIDMIKGALNTEQPEIPVVCCFLCRFTFLFQPSEQSVRQDEPYYVPPYPDTSRYYLNLFSVLVI